MKICSAFSTETFVFPLTAAIIQTFLAVYAVNTLCDRPYSAAGVFLFCFITAYFAGSPAFTAALAALIASRYVEERRFFRFAAMMLAAALFDMSVPEVKNRVTITGAIEIGRAPGVVTASLRVPVRKLQEKGLWELVRDQYHMYR
jgi:hypothetical protein